MGEAGVRRMVVPAAHQARMRHVGNVEDDRATIEVPDPGAVGSPRVHIGVVRAKSRVELLVSCRRRLRISVAGPRQPPATDLDRPRRLAHVHDPVELVVLRMARLEVGGAARAMDVAAVDEPQVMHAARVRPRGVEECDGARMGGVPHVEHLEAGRGQADPARLVGDDEHVADEIERVRPHVAVRQLGLHDDCGIARLGHVHGGHVLRRGLMRQPQHAPAVAGELDAHAFANVPEAVELVVTQEPHVLGKIGLCHGDPSRLGMVPSSRAGVTDWTCEGGERRPQ